MIKFKIDNPSKIFITGVTATGKTYWAKKLSEKFGMTYYDFDFHWDFTKKNPEYEKEFLDNLPDSFIIDAIPYTNRYNSFQEYRKKNDTSVICTFNSDITKWIKNVINKNFYTVNSPQFIIEFYNAWIYFYTIEIETIKPDFFCDNNLDKLITPEEFEQEKNKIITKLKILKSKNQPLFKDYLDTFDPKVYDKFYQDIECINFIGYSKSYETWSRIKDLVDWKNKTVIDLGCYHGYFSFKAEQQGASNVTGLEMHSSVLDITRMIKHMNQSKANFQIWECGRPTPEADIALVLNILHHAKNIDETLQNINAKIVIFEIEKRQVEDVERYFKITKEIESHRVDDNQSRIILLGEKLNNVKES